MGSAKDQRLARHGLAHDELTLRRYVDRPLSGTLTPIGSGPAEGVDIDFASLIERFAQ